MLVHEFLEHSAARLPDKVALVHGEHRLTYCQIDALANRLAHALIAQGVSRGDRVAIHLPNSVEAVVAIFATLKAGGVFVMVNSSTKEDKLLVLGEVKQQLGSRNHLEAPQTRRHSRSPGSPASRHRSTTACIQTVVA